MAPSLTERPPTVGKLCLMLVVWIGVSLATSAVSLRAFLRLRYNGRFQLDDIFTLLALLLLIASGIMYTVALKPLYHLSYVSAGLQPFPQGTDLPPFMAATALYLRLQFAITLAFWTCLWVVKASFLAFFYPLSTGLRGDRILWYVVAAYTFLGYVTCVVSYPISCSEFTLGTCATPRNIHLSIVSLKMSTALDISSDLFIIVIPWKLLWVVKRTRKEKMAIGSIVALGIFIILFAIIRIIVTNTTHTHPEVVWLALWSSIETSVAVIVISLTSLKVFFSKSGTTRSGYSSKNSGAAYAGTGERINSGWKSLSRSVVVQGGIHGEPMELTDTCGAGGFRNYNGEVRKGGTSNESDEVLVYDGYKSMMGSRV